MVQEKQGVLASLGGTIGGPRFIEQDDVSLGKPAPHNTNVNQ